METGNACGYALSVSIMLVRKIEEVVLMEWKWTIVLADGESWNCSTNLTIYEVLNSFFLDGHREEEIVAVIRH